MPPTARVGDLVARMARSHGAVLWEGGHAPDYPGLRDLPSDAAGWQVPPPAQSRRVARAGPETTV